MQELRSCANLADKEVVARVTQIWWECKIFTSFSIAVVRPTNDLINVKICEALPQFLYFTTEVI